MDRDPLNPDATSLEDAFFAKQDAALLQKLKEQARVKERRDALREVAPGHFTRCHLAGETVF